MTWLYVPGLESSKSALAWERWVSLCETHSPGLELFALSSGKPTARPCSWSGWKTRPWIASLSGPTSPPSTVERGVAAWISSLRAYPASPSPSPASDERSETSAGSGRSYGDALATWEPSSSSWRTSQGSLPLGSATSSPTWPRAGGLRSGTLYQRPTSAHRTSASASSSSLLLPTPVSTTSETRVNRSPSGGAATRPLLTTAAARGLLSTPTSSMASNGNERRGGATIERTALAWTGSTPAQSTGSRQQGATWIWDPRAGGDEATYHPDSSGSRRATGQRPEDRATSGGASLTGRFILPTPTAAEGSGGAVVALASVVVIRERPCETSTSEALPTPSARDCRSGGVSEETMKKNARPLNERVASGNSRLRLSPEFVEAMMGLPLGWTSIRGSAAWLPPSSGRKHTRSTSTGPSASTPSATPSSRRPRRRRSGSSPRGSVGDPDDFG